MNPNIEFVKRYSDYAAHTFGIDRNGYKAVLAVQKWLAVVDLKGDSPKAIRKLNTHGKHEIKAVEWNPHRVNENLIASASHNQVDIWDLKVETSGALLCSLKAHTKQTFGLNWNPFDCNSCSTCSADSYVYIWDIRDHRRPKIAFKTVAGASNVRWNRLNSQQLASVHDSDVRIWDIRKASAVGFISAHLGKIHCIDWSHQVENKLLTCSQDATIKIWDATSTRIPLNTLNPPQPQPVLRALYTPFGHGIVSVCAPALHGSDPRVYLWGSGIASGFSRPIHYFSGSQNPINELQWIRKNGSDKFYLATWSKLAKELMIWTVPPEIEEACTSESTIEAGITSAISDTQQVPARNSSGDSVKEVDSSGHLSGSVPQVLSPKPLSAGLITFTTLDREFSSVNTDLLNVTIEKRDTSQKCCRVNCSHGDKTVTVEINFPAFYPEAAPYFIIDKTATNLGFNAQMLLLRSMNEVVQPLVKENRPCLQVCLDKLSSLIETNELKTNSEQAVKAVNSGYPSPGGSFKRKESFTTSSFADSNIPFPRTCGGRFSGNGLMVTFLRPSQLTLITHDPKKHPKTMEAVTSLRTKPTPWGHHQSGQFGTSPSNLPTFPGGKTQPKTILPYVSKGRGHKSSSSSNPYITSVKIHDTKLLLPIDLDLAKAFVLSAPSIEAFCQDNIAVSASLQRPDLVQAFSLAALVASVNTIPPPPTPEDGRPWAFHPFARPLIVSLLDYYWKQSDVQSVAVLSCVFEMYDKLIRSHFDAQPLLTILPARSLTQGSRSSANSSSASSLIVSPSYERFHPWRNSWNITQEYTFPVNEAEEDESQLHVQNCMLLGDSLSQRCYAARSCYGNILNRWQLMIQRAELLNIQSVKEPDHYGIEFGNICQHCNSSVRGPKCHCLRLTMKCQVCHTAVKGLSNFCLSCGHGGHSVHLREWFQNHDSCPAGCGCNCLENCLKTV